MMPQAAGGMDINVAMQRLRRLAMLDTSVFDELRADANATVPAIIVSVVASLLFGLGGWLWYTLEDYDARGGDVFIQSFILGTIVSLILMVVWGAIVYVLLTQVWGARTDLNELIRVMGFADAPLALGVLLFIPALGWGISVAAIGLLFGLQVLAVQSTTNASAGRVFAANAAGFAVWAIVLSLLAADYPWDSIVPNIFIGAGLF